jgi:hypothetical protein
MAAFAWFVFGFAVAWILQAFANGHEWRKYERKLAEQKRTDEAWGKYRRK